ncbi:MAG: YdcF family protein [Planctomycetes bacterium]|nr:YdcF family protein [Planctomycetota bacterium]
MRRRLRLVVRVLSWIASSAVLAATAANAWLIVGARDAIHPAVDEVPKHDVALVLGTTPRARSGLKNRFFERRMDAAAELYLRGRVRHLLISGDHAAPEYDEVAAMQAALVERGVPVDAITLDHAGLRTLDSVARAKLVFGLDRAVIVTDDFHAPRALFLARAFELDAVAFPSHVDFAFAPSVPAREVLARVLAVIDVAIGTRPKFEGPPEAIWLK